MKIGTDKWKHFGINYAICALLGDYGVPFALGASLGKEYGDEMGLEGYSGRPGRDRGGLFDACMYRPDYNVTFSTLLI